MAGRSSYWKNTTSKFTSLNSWIRLNKPRVSQSQAVYQDLPSLKHVASNLGRTWNEQCSTSLHRSHPHPHLIMIEHSTDLNGMFRWHFLMSLPFQLCVSKNLATLSSQSFSLLCQKISLPPPLGRHSRQPGIVKSKVQKTCFLACLYEALQYREWLAIWPSAIITYHNHLFSTATTCFGAVHLDSARLIFPWKRTALHLASGLGAFQKCTRHRYRVDEFLQKLKQDSV